MSDDHEIKLDIDAPILEAPPQDSPAIGSGVGTLFPEDSMALATTKLTALESMVTLLTRDLKFGDFMREILLIVMKVVKSEAGSIFEINHEENCLFFRAMVGTSSDRLAQFKVPIGQGIVGHVAESRQPLVVDNVAENKIHFKSIQQAVSFEAKNLVAVPIVIRGRVFGVLELLNRVGEASYTTQDVEFLGHLCGYVAKVIEIRLTLSWALQYTATQNRDAA